MSSIGLTVRYMQIALDHLLGVYGWPAGSQFECRAARHYFQRASRFLEQDNAVGFTIGRSFIRGIDNLKRLVKFSFLKHLPPS